MLWSISFSMGRTSAAVYNINYHFVFCPKYRKPILVGKIEMFLKDCLETIVCAKGWELIELEVMPDHVHIFISAQPEFSPVMIIKVLKGVTSLRLFKKHPELKDELWGGHLWAPSYYIGTAGNMSAETIRKYIENQKGDSSTL